MRLVFCALLLLLAAPIRAQGDAVAMDQLDFGPRPVPAYGAMLATDEQALALLEAGRAQMLAFRLDEAEATFRRLAAAPTGRPAAAYHRMTLALWRALMAEREPFYGRFFAAADSVLEAVDDAPDGPWRTHLRAEAEYARGVVHAKQRRYLQAATALRSACGGFASNLREHPDFWESYKGAGLCHVAVGAVPRSYRWMLRLVGFSGTVRQGMGELAQAAERSAYGREESALYLAVVDAKLNESKGGGLAALRRLHAAHPTSPMVSYLLAFLLLDARAAEEAESLLRSAAAAQAAAGVEDIPYVDFYLGEALFRQNRFDEALPLYERYASTYRGEALVAQAHLHAGLCREMAGDRRGALVHYAQIQDERDYDSDAAALREAARLIERPMTATERTLLLGRNRYDGGRYREAIATLQPVLGDASAAEVERAEAAYRSGRAYHALGVHDEALRHYALAVAAPGDPLAKWAPWSQYHIGEVHETAGDRAAARAAYRAALENEEEFDYHKGLEQRARTALGRL